MLQATLKVVLARRQPRAAASEAECREQRQHRESADQLRDIGFSLIACEQSDDTTSRAFVPPCIPGPAASERCRQDCLSRTSTDRSAGTLDAHLPDRSCKQRAAAVPALEAASRTALRAGHVAPSANRTAVQAPRNSADCRHTGSRRPCRARAPDWLVCPLQFAGSIASKRSR